MNTALMFPGPLRALRNIVLSVVLLGLLFVALEVTLVPTVNRVLDRSSDTYALHIDDLHLRPWAAGWTIDGLTVHLRSAPDAPALLEVPHLDANLDGEALLRGDVVGALTLSSPTARFFTTTKDVAGKGAVEEVVGIDRSVAELLRGMLPVAIDTVSVHDGAVQFVTDVALPMGAHKQLDLRVRDLSLTASNLANSDQLTDPLFSTVRATAQADGFGALRGTLRFDPHARAPTFELDAAVTGIALPALNDWSLAFGRFTFERGTLDLYTEVTAKDGRFRGFVKPIADDVAVVALHKDLGSRLVAGIVHSAASALTGPGARARLPFEGRLGDANVDVITAILSALKAALLDVLGPLAHNLQALDLDTVTTHVTSQVAVVALPATGAPSLALQEEE